MARKILAVCARLVVSAVAILVVVPLGVIALTGAGLAGS